MKLIVLCFLVTFACISAQQNGLNTFVYKAIADPTRQIMKTANIPGTQFIDIGEGFAKALDTTVASFIPFGQSSSNQGSGINPLEIFNRFAQTGQSMTQEALGTSQNLFNSAQTAANGIFGAGQNGVNSAWNTAQQTGQSIFGFGQRAGQQATDVSQQAINSGRDVLNTVQQTGEQAFGTGQGALNTALNSAQQTSQGIISAPPSSGQ